MSSPIRLAAWYAIAVLIGVCGMPSVAWAQITEVRGTIRDSASGAPVSGAVVSALNTAGELVVRTISRENGTYHLPWAGTIATLRVMRMGFRPADVHAGALPNVSASQDIRLVSLPRAIDAMEVITAQGCAARDNQGEAFGLLDQARAGLLSMVVANEQQTPNMRVVRFERLMDLNGLEVEHQTVQLDSAVDALTPFNAVHSAIDFVEQGFRSERNGVYTFYAPDATVLLDTRFQRGYCFHVAERDPSRPSLMGLRFTPAHQRGKQVDIDGILWVDTTTHTLSDITFKYLGVEPLAAAFGAGGDISFQSLPNGVTFIDRWRLRLIGSPDPATAASRSSVQSYAIREVGGELTDVQWPDGTRWQAPLTALQVTVVTEKGRPSEGASVSLVGTNYRATADVYGRATIPNLLPGEYAVSVGEPTLQPIHLEIPVRRTVTAKRASTVIAQVVAPKAESYLALLCRSVDPDNTGVRVLGRVMSPSGQSRGGVNWKLSTISNGQTRAVTGVETTPTSGIIHTCKSLDLGTVVELAVWSDVDPEVRVRRVLVDSLTVIPVTLPGRMSDEHAFSQTLPAPLPLWPVQVSEAAQYPSAKELHKSWIRHD
jgi:hypothetical protein